MELRVYGAQVPLVVFGVIALLAALLVTFMPETSRTRLPDTIQVRLQLIYFASASQVHVP